MNTFQYLLDGFSVALLPENLLFCLVGVVAGTLVGALPGIGPTGAVALLLPATFNLTPAGALIMLAGIFYGTQYGGTITSVLMGLPGESASVVTTFDGYQLAKQGRAGAALGIASIGSFIGGTLSVVGLMLLGPSIAGAALAFGPSEYFALMILALTLVSAFSGGSIVKGLIAASLGLLLAQVGQDTMTGAPRLTFGQIALLDGIDFLPLTVGLFGLSEILEGFESESADEKLTWKFKWRELWPTLQDFRESFWPIIRGSVIGFFTGVLPGAGATIASFLSYGLEQRVSRNPERFGKGAIAGVAGPETANNASTGGSFVPMLSLGIPGSGTTAVLLGAFVMFGLQPGPALFQTDPDVVWGLVASMYIGNVLLVLINTLGIPLIVRFVESIRQYMPLVVLLLSTIGVYSYRNSVADLVIMLTAGVVGYVLRKVRIPEAPIILGLILGGMAETNLRQALTLADGNFAVLLARPITATLMALAVLSVLVGWWSSMRRRPV